MAKIVNNEAEAAANLAAGQRLAGALVGSLRTLQGEAAGVSVLTKDRRLFDLLEQAIAIAEEMGREGARALAENGA
jgi:hypothetical protein